MKAYVCREFGPVDSHKVEEIEDPRAEPGMVVIDVKAAGRSPWHGYGFVYLRNQE